jgi:hypothetical protein
MIEKNDVTKVKCIMEMPERPMFVKNSTYEAHPVNRGGDQITTWVGISGTSGYDFHESAFKKHFERV